MNYRKRAYADKCLFCRCPDASEQGETDTPKGGVEFCARVTDPSECVFEVGPNRQVSGGLGQSFAGSTGMPSFLAADLSSESRDANATPRVRAKSR